MKTVLAPIDFSEVTERVVQEAAALARGIGGRVVLLNIVQPPVSLAESGAMVDLEEITRLWQDNATRRLDQLEQKLKDASVPVGTVRITGSPVHHHILMQVAELDPEYIVMGSHGHRAIYDLLVGTTTHGVLKHVKCPVVIVPAAKAGAKVERAESHAAIA